jgi:hypothetical protein
MKITKFDFLAKEYITVDVPITVEQFERVQDRFQTKELIQNIVPELSKEYREFLITGYGLESQKILFGTEEE